jgi:hypothetical protein
MPPSVPVEEHDDSRRLDFSFAIHNNGTNDLEFVALEHVYNASGALLIQLRPWTRPAHRCRPTRSTQAASERRQPDRRTQAASARAKARDVATDRAGC